MKKTQRNILAVTIFTISIITVIMPLLIYRLIFNGGLANAHSAWGEFGSYFSGVVGTILSFINLIILTVTLLKQKREQVKIEAKQINDEVERDDFEFRQWFNQMISQKGTLIESFTDGQYHGNKDLRYKIYLCLGHYKVAHQFNDSDFLNEISKFTSLFSFLIYIGKEISNQNDKYKNRYYSQLRSILSGEELLLLIIYREFKQVSAETLSVINMILGDYSKLRINDFANATNVRPDDIQFYKTAFDKGVLSIS